MKWAQNITRTFISDAVERKLLIVAARRHDGCLHSGPYDVERDNEGQGIDHLEGVRRRDLHEIRSYHQKGCAVARFNKLTTCVEEVRRDICQLADLRSVCLDQFCDHQQGKYVA